jgi:hypothetical protein
MAIYNTTVPTSAGVLASGSGNRAITTVIVCNTGVTDRTLTLYAVPNPGTTAATGNMIVNALSVPAGETVSFDQEKLVLSTSDELQGLASGAGLTATISILPV